MTSIAERFNEHIASYNLRNQCGGEGDPDAKIVFIGEYPGEQEALFNKPFVGGSGKFLWSVVRPYGIYKDTSYSTNVVKRRVTSSSKVEEYEYHLWKEALEWELDQLPNKEIIVCLGNTAMTALLGHNGIIQHRGSVYDYKGCKVLCAYNPAYPMRFPQNEIIFRMDMSRLNDLVKGDFAPHHIDKVINPTFPEAMSYMRDILETHKRFSMDIEVVGGETACIGLAHSPNYAMCINFRDRHKHRYSTEEEFILLKKFARLCDDPSTTVIAQNGNFDAYFMGFKDHCLFKLDFDTLLAHHTLYPRLPHNLGFLTAQYTTHPFYKDDKDTYKEGGDIDSFWEYNATDCAITFAVADALEKELKAQGLHDFFTTHVMRMNHHTAKATVDGIATNQKIRETLIKDLTKDLSHLYNRFQNAVQVATGNTEIEINPRSPKQLAELFYDRLGCRNNNRSTAAPVRENWLNDPRVDDEIKDVILALDNYTKEAKFFSTYVDTKLDEDHRFRSEYKQFGTQSAPGRLSSSQTLWKSGGNAQNLPHRAYEMFIADEGCVFVYFDLAQAEARYVGWDANIEQWIEDFERARIEPGFDAHRSLASTMFDIPYDETSLHDFVDANGKSQKDPSHDPATLEPTQRYVAKRCRHGLNYRMQIPRLAQTTGLSLGQAARNFYIYHKTNPELKIWWQTLERLVKRKKMLFNSYGRRLFITERLDDESMKSIVAFRPQSTIGDKVQRVWYQCHEDDRWDLTKARICMNVHDALWGIATKPYAKTALSIMKQYAEEPINVTSVVTNQTRPLIIPADTKISNTENGLPLSMANMKEISL